MILLVAGPATVSYFVGASDAQAHRMPHERLARTGFVIDISMVMEELVPVQGIRPHHASAPTMAQAERGNAGRQVLYLLRTVSNQRDPRGPEGSIK